MKNVVQMQPCSFEILIFLIFFHQELCYVILLFGQEIGNILVKHTSIENAQVLGKFLHKVRCLLFFHISRNLFIS